MGANPDRVIRIGIIGAGQIGQRHIETYQSIPGVEVAAVCGRRPEPTRAAAQRFGIPHATTDIGELLARPDLEAVDVCLHNNLHAPVTVAALEAGKHVYCEKPMAGSYRDAAAMLAAARRADRLLSIQLATLFAPETKAAEHLIRQGALGRLYYASSMGLRRRGRPYVDGYGTPAFVQKELTGGGALFDMGVYHLAQVLYLLGNPAPERLTGRLYQETEMDPARQAESGYDVEELGVGFVRLAGGISLQVFEAWAAHLGNQPGSFLLGSQGGVQLAPFAYYHSQGDLELDSRADLNSLEYRLHNVRGTGTAYDGPQAHWIAALRGRVPLLPTAEVALNTMLVSEGLALSDRLGREVTAEEVIEQSVSTALPLG
jgi:predicted dehydrogenase